MTDVLNRLCFAALLSGALSTGAAPALAADCSAPGKPQMPNGASATMDAMLAGQKAVKDFQASNMTYMKCLEDSFNSAEKTMKAAGDDSTRAAAKAEYESSVEAYNAAVSAEEEVAGAFNVELRAYRAANPKK